MFNWSSRSSEFSQRKAECAKTVTERKSKIKILAGYSITSYIEMREEKLLELSKECGGVS